MEWLEATVYTTTIGIEVIADMLTDFGIYGVEIIDAEDLREFLAGLSVTVDYVDDALMAKRIDETEVKFYVEAGGRDDLFPAIRSRLEEIRAEDLDGALGRLVLVADNVLDESWLDKWREHYKPFRVGQHVVVRPFWEEYTPADGDAVVTLNPGHIFGTGLHQTTQLVMAELEKFVKPESRILDIGCGSGILAATAMKLGAAFATLTEIEPSAKNIIDENMGLNSITDYEFIHGDIIGNESFRARAVAAGADIVVCNIIADVILAILPFAKTLVKADGVIILSGIILSRGEEVVEAVKTAGFTPIAFNVRDEWVAITAKPSQTL